MKPYLQEYQNDLIIASLDYGYDVKDVAELFNRPVADIVFLQEISSKFEYGLKLKKEYYSKNSSKKYISKPIVYFIQQQSSEGLIKIGYTEKPIEFRLNSLRTSSPYTLILLKTIEGSFDKEQEMHKLFAEENVNREWFYPSERLLTYINNL